MSIFKKIPYDLLALALALAITVASLAPAPDLQAAPGGDKVLHLAAYGLLSILAMMQRRSFGRAAIVLFAVMLLGGIIEVVQPFTGRQGELADLVANIAGALMGAISVWLLRRFVPIAGA